MITVPTDVGAVKAPTIQRKVSMQSTRSELGARFDQVLAVNANSGLLMRPITLLTRRWGASSLGYQGAKSDHFR